VLDFPVNLPGPFFNALGSVFLVSFLFQVLYLVDQIRNVPLFSLFRPIEPLLYILIFFIVLIVQFVHLFSQFGEEGEMEQMPSSGKEPPERDTDSGPSPGSVSWEEVETEFRMFLYDFFHSLRNTLRKK
jgi:hypothetical protein